jgi:adenylate kinase
MSSEEPAVDPEAAAPEEEEPAPEPVDCEGLAKPLTGAPDQIETTFAIVKPDARKDAPSIIKAAEEAGFVVAHSKVLTMTPRMAREFYSEHFGKNFFGSLVDFMTSGECIALALRKANAVADWRTLIGPTSALRAKEQAPDSIRARFGTDNTKNAVHGSASIPEALAELSYFFPKYYVYQRTVAMVMPDADPKHVEVIESKFKEWQFTTLKESAIDLSSDPAKAKALAEKWIAEMKVPVSTDPSEDEGSFLMPYNMRAHDPALDVPPPKPKTAEELAEEAAAQEEAPAEEEPAPAEEGDGYAAVAKAPLTVESLTKLLLSGPMKCFLLGRYGAVHALNCLTQLGAKLEAANPGVTGGLEGLNTVHSSASAAAAQAEIKCCFGDAALEVERTLAIIKPNAFSNTPLIRKLITLSGFTIEDQLSLTMNSGMVDTFYAEHLEAEFFPDLKAFMTSGPCQALVLQRPGAVQAWRALIGPTNSFTAKEEQPMSLRGLFGEDQTKNGTHGSASVEDAQREIGCLFPCFFKYEKTLAIIKPDAVDARHMTVENRIRKAGFRIVDSKWVTLSASEAACFFVPENTSGQRAAETSKYMSSGPSHVLVLGRCNAVRHWHDMCGPSGSEDLVKQNPNSLRALVLNAQSSEVRDGLHAPSTPEQANKEIGFFFPRLVAEVLRSQGPPAGTDTAAYMERELQSTLTKGLTQLCKTKPPNPLRWLSQWLSCNNPNKPKVVCPPPPPKPMPKIKLAKSSKNRRDHELVLVCNPPNFVVPDGLSKKLASILVSEFGFLHVDIDQALEEEVQSQSQIGAEVDRLRKSGGCLPYAMACQVLQVELAKCGGKKHVVTGFPKNMDWVRGMEKHVGAATSVLFLEPAGGADAITNTATAMEAANVKWIGANEWNTDLSPAITYYEKKKVLTRLPVPVDLGPTWQAGGPAVDENICKAFFSKRATSELGLQKSLTQQFFSSKPRHLIYLLGPAACGRSTVAAAIANKYNFRHINAEQLMCNELAAKSAVGDQIDACLKGKKPIPQELVLSLVRDAVQQDTCPNFVIDGFPGSIEEMTGIEQAVGVPCDAAVLLTCSSEVLAERRELYESSDTDPTRLIEIARGAVAFPSSEQKAVLDYLKGEEKLVEVSAEQYEEDVLMDLEVEVLSNFKPRYKIYFVLGGPGSGKGTQCQNLVDTFGFKHLSAGDLLRAEVKSGSPDGAMISEMIRNGQIVPAHVTVKLLKNAMDKSLASTFLIDGFPRDMGNVEEWEQQLPSPELVLVFDCPESELEARLLRRGETSGRSDDNIASIKKRFKTFVDQSMPAIKYYSDRNLVKTISSVPPPAQVFNSVKKHFKDYPVVPDLIFVLGGPGSGKGTQCAKISEDYGFVHMSAGDLLRDEIQQGTKDGSMIAQMIREGKIVPHEITIRLLQKALHRSPDKKKFLIDGFPRAIGQALAFEEMVGRAKMVLFFDAPDDVLTERMLQRGQTSGRTDDNQDAIQKRLVTYHRQSKPVVEHYRKSPGYVHTFDVTKGPSEVYADVEKVLSQYNKQRVVWVTGQPLSGKTLVAQRLASAEGGIHLNFSELLKAEVLSTSQLGRQIGMFVKRQEKVPSELVVRVVKAAVDRSNAGLLVLDGFPRKQAEADMLFSEIGDPKLVLYLDTTAAGEPDQVSIERIREFDTDGDGMLSKEEFTAAGYIGTMLQRSKAEGSKATTAKMIEKLNQFMDETVPVVTQFEPVGIVRKLNATEGLDHVIEQAKHTLLGEI